MDRFKLFSFIFCCLASFSFAQTAQDFTVTDVEGETHTLYTYLNEGKHVVLSFMYTG